MQLFQRLYDLREYSSPQLLVFQVLTRRPECAVYTTPRRVMQIETGLLHRLLLPFLRRIEGGVFVVVALLVQELSVERLRFDPLVEPQLQDDDAQA